MPRTATIGPEIFERVNALVAEGKSRTEAFAQVGQERGSRPGTVAANYYRVARSQGKPASRRRASTSRQSGGRPTRATSTRRQRATTATRAATDGGDGEISQIARQIAELTERLVRQVEQRDEKLRELLG